MICIGSMATARLAELLGGLSLFADLADGFPPEKVLRSTLLAVEIARREGLGAAEVRDVYYVTLLRYAGCVGFSHEEAHVYGAGNDIATRSVMAMADPTEPLGTLLAIARGVGKGAALPSRARAVAALLSDRHAIEKHARTQCETALWAARAVSMSDGVVAALGAICERWDGLGAPGRLAGEALALPMRVHQVGDVADIALGRLGVGGARELVARRAGKQLDPRFAGRFVADADELAALVSGSDVWERYLAAEPEPFVLADASAVARAFANLADLKSVFTAGHSPGVAARARLAARELGLGGDVTVELERAGWLHDLGRAAIANAVWDKPGPLGAAEREQVRMHAYYTDRILGRAPTFAAAARIAAATHERCDGGGYYRGLPGATLEPAARLLAAADAFTAMQELRPHRPAMSAGEAADALAREARDGRLCPRSVDAVIASAGVGSRPTTTPGAGRGLSDREIEVLVLLARGKSNREIGALLDISPRTVQNHVAHVYDKIGVYSRAGATLFAVEAGLVGAGARDEHRDPSR